MGLWPDNLSVHTTAGNDMAAALPDAGILAVTKAVLGRGRVEAKRETLGALTEICEPVMECPVKAVYLGDGKAEVTVFIDNEELETGFDLWQVGLTALDAQGAEVLFFIQQAAECDHIPTAAQTPLEVRHIINIEHSNMLEITVKPPDYLKVPYEEFIPVRDALGDKEPLLTNAPAKAALADADTLILTDSEDDNKTKKSAFGSIFNIIRNRIIRPDVVNGALTLYVSPDGSDTAGDGSSSKTYKTIGKVAQVYNGLVGVSNCTIRLMDGTYTLTANVVFYILGTLSFMNSSANRSNVIVTGAYDLSFYGGYALIRDLTRRVSGFWRMGFFMNCAADIQNCDIDGVVNDNTVGVRAHCATISVMNSNISTCIVALYAYHGNLFSSSIGGSGNSIAYAAESGIIASGSNTITASTLISEANGGRIFL